MENTDPYSQVYQGREGTGAAFLLNGNRGADIFNTQVAQKEQQRRLAELQRQKAAQDQQDLINKNLSDVKLADHWNAHDKELQGEYTSLMNNAATLKTQNIDASTNPEWKSKYSSLDSKAKYSGQLLSGFDALYKELNSPGAIDKYSDKSIADAIAYYDPNKPLSKYIEEGKIPPQLQPKYTLGGLLKDVKGTDNTYESGGKIITETNRSENIKKILPRLEEKGFKSLVTQAGGDPNMSSGFPIPNGNGGTTFPTSDEALAPIAQKALSNLSVDQYPQLGLQSTTPEDALIELTNKMKNQNAIVGKIVSDGADLINDTNKSKRTDYQAIGQANWWRQFNYNVAKDNKKDEVPTAAIESNVITNVASTDVNGKTRQMPSTSWAATNVGNSKESFMPRLIYNPNDGTATENSASFNITGGQVHIKPVLRYKKDGKEYSKLLDDDNIENIKKGTYTIAGSGGKRFKPSMEDISNEEILYGQNTTQNEDGKNITSDVVFPISGQALDGKFDKKYDQQGMRRTFFTNSNLDIDQKIKFAERIIKEKGINLKGNDLEKEAFNLVKKYNQ